MQYQRLSLILKRCNNMKQMIIIILTILAAVSAGITLKAFLKPMDHNSNLTDTRGHVFVRLWKEYYDALSADRPKKQIEALDAIKKIAREQRVAWDFWDAADKYVSASLFVDWKLRDSLEAQLGREVADFDEPVMTIEYYSSHSALGNYQILEYIKNSAERLKKAQNKPFYLYTGGIADKMSGQLPEYISNDYEYVLWNNIPSFGNNKGFEDDRSYQLLNQELGARYPDGAYLNYLSISAVRSAENRSLALKEFALKYKGKAIGMYAEADLLSMKKDSLDEGKSSSEEYHRFYEECKSFEKRRGAFAGKEAALVGDILAVKNLISELTAGWINVEVIDGQAMVMLRNLKDVTVEVFPDDAKKPVFRKTAINDKHSFYVIDTLKVELPKLDDGHYSVSAYNGKETAQDSYSRYRLSIAQRRNSQGYGIYVADYMTGKPLKKVNLSLLKNGKEVVSVNDFVLKEGFTQLPDEILSAIKPKAWQSLVASAKDSEGYLMKSQDVQFNGDEYHDIKPGTHNYINLYMDRKAYNPGDTAYFKAVLYRGDMVNYVKASGGKPVTVSLSDSEGNKLKEIKLATNEFGSVSGEFALPKGLRNGMFEVKVKSGAAEYYDRIRVDEFVLPTYDLVFDNNKKLYLPGDTVTVTGKINSYSGHSLSSAKVVYTASNFGEVLSEGEIEVGNDGKFILKVPSSPEDMQYINVNIKVTDSTGETHEYNTGVYVAKVITVSLILENETKASMRLDIPKNISEKNRKNWQASDNSELLRGDKAEVKMSVKRYQGEEAPLDISYSLFDENDNKLESGKVHSGDTKSFDFSSRPDGIYTVKAEAAAVSANGSVTASDTELLNIVKINGSPKVLNAPVDYIFWSDDNEIETGEQMKAFIGTSSGKDLWAVIEVYGDRRELIDSKLVHLSGKRGKSGSLTELSYLYKKEFPDAVNIQIVYFRDSEAVNWTNQFRRVRHTLDLPLEFSRFEDKTLPGKEYIFRIKTDADVECVASVYDKSLDNIAVNSWRSISLSQFDIPSVYVRTISGHDGAGQDFIYNTDCYLDEPVMAYGMARPKRLMIRGLATKSKYFVAEAESAAMDSEAAEDVQLRLSDDMPTAEQEAALSKVEIRNNFANLLTFQPFIRSGQDGNMELKFKTSDKLSTYYVQLFAHDKNMRNAVISREMVVSVPVKVAVVEPRYLYDGDEYKLATSVSSNSDKDISGTLALYQYDGEDYKNLKPLKSSSVKINIPAGKSVARDFRVTVPSDANRESGKPIGLKVVFVTDDGGFSDGIFVPVPVYRNAQVLTEAHSAVLLSGMDKEALIKKIRDAFVNVSSYGAEYKEIPIIDMVRDAIPSKVNPSSDNILDMSEAYYIRLVAQKLGVSVESDSPDFIPNEKLVEKILACRNADGGFGWFEGMNSSPIITSVILERFAKLRDAGLLDISKLNLDEAVRFMDKREFDFEWPYWCGGVSTDQYLYVRSLYPSVDFNVRQVGNSSEFSKRMTEFKKYVRKYLVPSGARGMNGYILGKTRRLMTLTNLVASSEGVALANAWGVRLGAEARMKKSLQADVLSLLEYAVDHRDGGVYYPNAVMPFRGLLESEAYAHSMLCDLLTAYSTKEYAVDSSSRNALRIADGIRIWLMLQKETQKWDDDEPAFVDAVNSVLSGSDEVKATKVILMKKTFEKPFEEIDAAGNGMRIERKFYLISSVEKEAKSMHERDGKVIEGVEIVPGTMLHKGDKIKIEYRIWNQENRSFVRLSAPREAALMPVQQLSGMYGWMIRPFYFNSWYSFMPRGYRNVKAAKSEYYFDSFPEEDTVISEEFFVTQSGAFEAPVVEIESLYAPHYRANGKFAGRLTVE